MLMARWSTGSVAFDGYCDQRGSNDRRCSQARSWLTAVVFAIALSFNLFTTTLASQMDSSDYTKEENQEESYCSYEGYVKTDRNWFGFLANMTMIDTGQLMFEFQYVANMCCPNVLFYTEDQISGISTRINCWQKEELLHPEDDQILRLTPMFAWSGCRLTRLAGVATYVCKGGRSLTSAHTKDQPVTWYVAVSNCAALYGLELTYHLEIHGQVVSCPTTIVALETTRENHRTTMTLPAPKAASLIPRQAEQTILERDQTICAIDGVVNTTDNWTVFLPNISFLEHGGFYYELSYPYHMQIQNLILYGEEEIKHLHGDQNCWEKESIIESFEVHEKIRELSFRATWNGCISKSGLYGGNLTCTGEQRFDEPRKVLLAVSNCRSNTGLLLYYKLGIFGFDNKGLCNDNRNQTMLQQNHFHLCCWLMSLLLGLWNLSHQVV